MDTEISRKILKIDGLIPVQEGLRLNFLHFRAGIEDVVNLSKKEKTQHF